MMQWFTSAEDGTKPADTAPMPHCKRGLPLAALGVALPATVAAITAPSSSPTPADSMPVEIFLSPLVDGSNHEN